MKASIVIPLFNKRELTANCLKSLALNTVLADIEVFAVDNASTDDTPKVIPDIGRELFGDNFHFVRNEINRNFAGASNQGANLAKGDFIVFLNNDTEVQKGWLPPLISDFAKFSELAGTGPILAYPTQTPLGLMVQHLGVEISPSYGLGHLYEGIPVKSSLAKRRRFFQAITAACMVIPRNLFLKHGGFDEGYVNGFEDVDLCARLWSEGFKFTVNPKALVLHHESQSHGRHSHETRNSNRLIDRSLNLLAPDWHLQVKRDRMVPCITDWLHYRPELPERLQQTFSAKNPDKNQLQEILLFNPYWEEGWKKLSDLSGIQDKIAIARIRMKLFKAPETALFAWKIANEAGDQELKNMAFAEMGSFLEPVSNFLAHMENAKDIQNLAGISDFAAKNKVWLDGYGEFKKKHAAFGQKVLSIADQNSLVLHPHSLNFYNAWSKPVVAQVGNQDTAFSILMPVYNPEPEHLKAALDSVMAQTHWNWELCIADDASTNPKILELIKEYASKDSRIRFTARSLNGGISEATNTCVDMAQTPWCVFLDQDDLLTKDALDVMSKAITENPHAALLYSDEDKTRDGEACFEVHFKGRWDPILFRSQNYICHLSVCQTERLRKIRFRKEMDGAQDHDMLLRFTAGLDAAKIVHVPEVLYHWRVHEKSTALDIKAKDGAESHGHKAVMDYLKKEVPGAMLEEVPGSMWPRVKYPLPEKGVSVVAVGNFDKKIQHLLTERTCLPLKFAATVHDIPEDAEFVCFVDSSITNISQNWLEELLSHAMLPDVGAVSGLVVNSSGQIQDCGYMFDASGKLSPLFTGLAPQSGSAWFGWDRLARSVDALSGRFILVRFDIFRETGGFAPSKPWATQDWCLKIGEKERKCIWVPFAQATFPIIYMPAPNPDFDAKWQCQPFNKNLKIIGQEFSLNLDRCEKSTSTSAHLKGNLYKLEDFRIHGDHTGNLVALEQGQQYDFDVKRIYYIWGTERNAIRGRHAHRDLKQLIVCLKGSCDFTLDDGKTRETFRLDRPTLGLYVENFVWREFTDFSPDCIVMVLASEHYDATDYIKDYDTFLKVAEGE